jgi:uncharacterized membrane protein
MNAYAVLKFVHVISATVLFGTGLGTAFQMWMTHRGGNITAIASAARLTVLADWLFTVPAVVVQPLSGFALVYLAGFSLTQPWLIAALILYAIAGACWLPVVALQLRVRRLSAAAVANASALPAEYFRCMRLWFLLGWPAFVALMVTFWLMVAKPVLW